MSELYHWIGFAVFWLSAVAGTMAVIAFLARWFIRNVMEAQHLMAGVLVRQKLRSQALKTDPEDAKQRLWNWWSQYADANTSDIRLPTTSDRGDRG